MSSIVVKRGGNDEPYDERKLYASIFISLRIVNQSEKESEVIAGEIVKILNRWLENKTHVTSHDIRRHAAIQLKEYNNVAAYVYTHHRSLS